MFNRFKIRTVVPALAALVAAAVGCGGSGTSPTPSPAPLALSPTVQQSIAPVITAVTPSAVSTGGGAWGTITGTGFQSGATVRFGGSAATYAYVDNSATIIRFGTAPHVAGPVDVVVTNPGGLADTATRGLEFKSPEAFDFNGTWTGHAGPEYETEMRFTVENNKLISVSCGGSALMQFSSSPSLANGEFSMVVSGGIEMSARIVSATSAVGTIKLGPCAESRWWGERAGSAREGQ